MDPAEYQSMDSDPRDDGVLNFKEENMDDSPTGALFEPEIVIRCPGEKKKSRSQNFTENEALLLAKLISKNSHGIKSKSVADRKARQKLWEKITSEFNDTSGNSRSAKCLKAKYIGLKALVRAKIDGSDTSGKGFSPVEEVISAIIVEDDDDLKKRLSTLTFAPENTKLKVPAYAVPLVNPQISEAITATPETPPAPPKKERKLKKTDWRVAERKKRQMGLQYVSDVSKKVMGPRTMGPPCECQLKCYENIPEDQRMAIFVKYWALGSIQLQREFIVRHMRLINPSVRGSTKQTPRNLNGVFFFTLNRTEIRVCKFFFEKTLGISDRSIRTAREKVNEHGVVCQDLRGKYENRPNALRPEQKDEVRDFLKRIPRVENHGLTDQEFIEKTSLAQMYREFKEQAKNKPVSESYFQRIFHTEFNISLLKPKREESEEPLLP